MRLTPKVFSVPMQDHHGCRADIRTRDSKAPVLEYVTPWWACAIVCSWLSNLPNERRRVGITITAGPLLMMLTDAFPCLCRNSKGYEIAEHFSAKFTHISPVWLQLRLGAAADAFSVTGQHDVDADWMRRVSQPKVKVS